MELRCALFGPDDDGKINLGLGYILVKEGDFRVDLLDEAAEDRERLTRIEGANAKISALGVPVERAENAGLLQGKRSSFVSTCAEEIEERYPQDIASRLIGLLQVDRFADPPPAPAVNSTTADLKSQAGTRG